MSTIVDARGNEFHGHLDQIGGQSITDPRTASATINAVNGEIAMDLNGKATALFEIRGTNAATYVFEVSLDGANYYQVPALQLQGTINAVAVQQQMVLSAVVTGVNAVVFEVSSSGFRRVRCRCTAFTSGSAIVAARASIADLLIMTQPLPATLAATGESTANTANASLLSVAPGTGFSVYICALQVDRLNPTITAVAAAATELAITLTGPSGGPAVWNTGVLLAASDQRRDVDLAPTQAIKCTTGTTVTLGVPAGGAGVRYRANMAYYLAA
jgi:hypothetical protein